MRIAHNAAIDHFRRNRKRKMVRPTDEFDIFDTLSNDAPSVEDRLVEEEILQELRQLVPSLPEEQQQVVQMRLERNLSFKEIAEKPRSASTRLGAHALCADQPASNGGRPKPRADSEVTGEGNGRFEGCTQ